MLCNALISCHWTGDEFDVRDYNEAILSTGRAPMGVVKRAVNKYIGNNYTVLVGSFNEYRRSTSSALVWSHIYTHVYQTVILSCITLLLS